MANKSPHTLQIAAERDVMEAFGVTRSQAREGLLKAARLTQEAEAKKQVEDEALSKRIQAKVDKAVAALDLPAVVQKFEPRPFRLNVDTPNVPIPAEVPTDTREVLVINPTNDIYGSPNTSEIITAVSWPDGTACTVDIGDQDDSIAFCGYRVTSGYLYLRWISFASGSALPTALSGNNVTITAFL